MLSPDLDFEKKEAFFIFIFPEEHVAHLRAQHCFSYTMQNLVSLLSHSPEGLS